MATSGRQSGCLVEAVYGVVGSQRPDAQAHPRLVGYAFRTTEHTCSPCCSVVSVRTAFTDGNMLERTE
jgi:hypothetical protein